MGEMFRDQEMNTGAMGIGKAPSRNGRTTPTLADVGITYSMSSQAQKLAGVG